MSTSGAILRLQRYVPCARCRVAEPQQPTAGDPPPHPYHPPLLRRLALQAILPMALVALLLFVLLGWEASRLLPAGSPALSATLLRHGLLLLAGLLVVAASGWLVCVPACHCG